MAGKFDSVTAVVGLANGCVDNQGELERAVLNQGLLGPSSTECLLPSRGFGISVEHVVRLQCRGDIRWFFDQMLRAHCLIRIRIQPSDTTEDKQCDCHALDTKLTRHLSKSTKYHLRRHVDVKSGQYAMFAVTPRGLY